MNQWVRLIPLASCLAVVCLSSSVEAGYIFMKNGYIIQGRVVEKDTDKVVLRWPEGTVTIQSRFIDDVVLDASEEEDIRQARELQREAAEEDDVMSGIGDQEVALTLPKRLGDMIALHDDPLIDDVDSGPDVEVGRIPGASDDPGTVDSGTEVPRITEIPTPSEERRFDWGRFALTPPSGWEVEEKGEFIQVDQPGEDTPSRLTVSFHSSLSVPRDEAREMFRTSLLATYPGLEILHEGDEQVGFERGYRIDGRFPGKNTRFSQILVEHGDAFYLIGIVQAGSDDAGTRKSLDDSLYSFRFLDE